jgi:hypothetical protein
VYSFSESFTHSGKQGGAAVLRKGHDIVTGETCIPASLNVNNLGEAAVLLARAVPISAYDESSQAASHLAYAQFS